MRLELLILASCASDEIGNYRRRSNCFNDATRGPEIHGEEKMNKGFVVFLDVVWYNDI